MRITLNGDAYEAPDGCTVRELLEKLELAGRRLAVLLDDEVVRKATFDETRVADGNRVEIIQMVGGG